MVIKGHLSQFMEVEVQHGECKDPGTCRQGSPVKADGFDEEGAGRAAHRDPSEEHSDSSTGGRAAEGRDREADARGGSGTSRTSSLSPTREVWHREGGNSCEPSSCQCHKPSELVVVKKEGPRRGKKFWKCTQREREFFQWQMKEDQDAMSVTSLSLMTMEVTSQRAKSPRVERKNKTPIRSQGPIEVDSDGLL